MYTNLRELNLIEFVGDSAVLSAKKFVKDFCTLSNFTIKEKVISSFGFHKYKINYIDNLQSPNKQRIIVRLIRSSEKSKRNKCICQVRNIQKDLAEL